MYVILLVIQCSLYKCPCNIQWNLNKQNLFLDCKNCFDLFCNEQVRNALNLIWGDFKRRNLVCSGHHAGFGLSRFHCIVYGLPIKRHWEMFVYLYFFFILFDLCILGITNTVECDLYLPVYNDLLFMWPCALPWRMFLTVFTLPYKEKLKFDSKSLTTCIQRTLLCNLGYVVCISLLFSNI